MNTEQTTMMNLIYLRFNFLKQIFPQITLVQFLEFCATVLWAKGQYLKTWPELYERLFNFQNESLISFLNAKSLLKTNSLADLANMV